MPPGPKVRRIAIYFEDHTTMFVDNPDYNMFNNSTGRKVKPLETWIDHQLTWSTDRKVKE